MSEEFFEIRRMAEKDLPQAAELEKLCFSSPRDEKRFERMFKEDTFFASAAFSGNKLIGYADMTRVLDEGYINNIAVSPEWRGKKIGSALLKSLILDDLGFLTLEVREGNIPAIGLYKKFGFEQVGRIKGYYSKPDEDALLFTLFLKKEADK